MIKPKRRYVPCWICGKEHTNPSSSSTCCECGPEYAIENRRRKRELREAEDRLLSSL